LLADAKFSPAISAINSGDVERLRALIRADATLTTSRSTTSHPTLLQCLVLEARDTPSQIEMARILIDAGADVNGTALRLRQLRQCRRCHGGFDDSGTALHYAALNGHWAMVEFLIGRAPT
jgi:ankyrin repeat protein